MTKEEKEILRLGLERAYRWQCQAGLRGDKVDKEQEKNAILHLELICTELCPKGHDLESWLGWGTKAKIEIAESVLEQWENPQTSK